MTGILKVDSIQSSGGTAAMTIDSSGRISLPQVIAFHAEASSDNTADGSIIDGWVTPAVNNGSGFNNTTGKFTAPVAGIYFFGFTCLAGAHSNSSQNIYLYKNNTKIVMTRDDTQNGRYQTLAGTAIMSLSVSDEVYLYNAGTGTLTGHTDPWVTFNGYKIG